MGFDIGRRTSAGSLSFDVMFVKRRGPTASSCDDLNRAGFGGPTAGVVERNTGGLGDGSVHLEPGARGIPVGPKGLRPKRTVAKATPVDKKVEPCESLPHGHDNSDRLVRLDL